MKKFILALSLFFFSSFAYSDSINQVVFFGDSLSDDGNLYRLLFKIVPKSPPYFQGRFSNGPTWSEYVGKHYYNEYYIPYRIYALGGATAIFHPPTTKFITTSTVDIEINYFLLEALLRNKSKGLYSIWIGGNDYLFDLISNPDKLTTDVIDKISWSIKTLITYGAKKFLVMNLPDLSIVPYSRINGIGHRMQYVTQQHNKKLLAEVNALRAKYPKIQIVYADIYAIFNEFLSDPDAFNKKYNTHIKNTMNACWHGGYLFKTFSSREMNEDIKQTLIKNNGSVPNGMDTETVGEMILNSPEISESYAIGAAYMHGIHPCKNADEYVFWDQIHPTEVVNKVISQVVVKQLMEEMPVS